MTGALGSCAGYLLAAPGLLAAAIVLAEAIAAEDAAIDRARTILEEAG